MATMAPEEKRTFMLTTPLQRLIPTMALPTIAGMLVTSIYNLADTFFVSQLGTYATGAVGVNSSIDSFIMLGGTLLAVGASSFTSRLLGAREDRHAREVLSTCFFTSLLMGLIILLVGSIFTDPILRTLGATEALLPYSRQYARYVMLAAPFMGTSFVLNQCLRAEGSAVYSMTGMVTGALLNIALDPVFIFDWGLGLGVAGASMATALSKLVSWTILILPYLRGRTLLRISIGSFRPRFSDAKEVLSIGSASFFRNALGTLAGILLNRIAVSFGESALAAISVANRITMLLTSACLGYGQGFVPVSGYAWGARHYSRVREAYRFAVISCVAGISVIAILVSVFARPLLLLFTEDDQELVRIGVFALRSQCLGLPFHGYAIIVTMLCSSIGRARGAVPMGLSRQGIFFLPILPLTTRLFGVWGVASIQGVADVLAMSMAIPIAVRTMRDVRKREAQSVNSSQNREEAQANFG